MQNNVKQMKWWGWGDEHIEFRMDDKPELWPYISKVLGIEGEPTYTPPVKLENIELPQQRLNQHFLKCVRKALRDDQIAMDKVERLVHSYGKSFRDLWRIRNGIVKAAPDIVVYPETEADIVTIVREAADHDVVLIPFGGGSNIAGSLEAIDDGRMIVSLDMKRMDKVLELDKESCVARIQAGVMGPHMEEQLTALGFTLGHFPDSFEYSSLGGWIATRSAGMQSDKYGKIEDMVISLRVVTPSGTIVTRTVPKSSNGIDVNHLCIGSEGILGIITEAAMQVHPLPECREFYGYVFPDFESGVAAVRESVDREWKPVIMRLNDIGKSQLSFAYKSKSSGFKTFLGKAAKSYLKNVKKFDLEQISLMLVAFEGNKQYFKTQRKHVDAIYKKYGAVALGTDPGKSFEKGKYDFPYLRDYVMDRNIMADVSETSTIWSNLLPLYREVMKAIETAIRNTGFEPFLGCHISHTYHSGASLYFTFGCQQIPGREIEQYLYIKKAAEDAFLGHGGTLSHHHAVGFEHLPWIKDDISETGIKAVQALKDGLDPKGVMNPGKIIPPSDAIEKWGLSRKAICYFDGKGESTNGKSEKQAQAEVDSEVTR